MSRMVSFSVLVGIIVVIGFLFYQVMATFLLPLFLAALLVVIFRPLHHWFLVQCKGHARLAAGLTTAAVLLIVLVPAVSILTTAALEASAITGVFDSQIKEKLEARRDELGLTMPFPDELRYFEAALESLDERTAGGSIEPLDKQYLQQLRAALETFGADLAAAPRYAHLVPMFDERVLEPFKAAVDGNDHSVRNHQQFMATARGFRTFKTHLLGSIYPPEPDEEAAGESGDQGVRGIAGVVQTVLGLIEQRELRAELIELANPTDQRVERLLSQWLVRAQGWFRSIGGATGELVAQLIFGLVIVVLSVYFFLVDGPAMVATMMRLSPLDDDHERELLEEFDRVSRAVVLATLLSAVVQGLLGGVGYWMAGMESVFLLTVLTTVFALVPFVGAAAVWAPVSLYLIFFEEHYWAGGLLALYGMVIVSMADNVIKPLVLHGQSNLHPLLALLSVLGGVKALGPIGVLVGPMVVAFLQTLLNILHRELTRIEHESAAAKTAG